MRVNKILFITESPFSFDLNGASSFSSGHLVSLLYAFPKSEILLLHLTSNEPVMRNQLETFIGEAGFQGHMNIETIPVSKLTFNILSLRSLLKFPFTSFSDKSKILFANIDDGLVNRIHKIMSDFNPDLIWAEHILPALLAVRQKSTTPVLYSHHDFIYRILKERNKFSIRNFLRGFMLQHFEKTLLKKVRFFVNGSEQERKIALEIHTGLKSFSFPAIYPIVKEKVYTNSRNLLKNRLLHIGTSSATANRIGLINFFKHVYPVLKQEIQNLECYFIGDQTAVTNEIFGSVANDPQIKIIGHVNDLTSVTEPYDIHILPYDRGTGTRTRLLNAIRLHGAVVVFEKTGNETPGLESGVDILVADNYNDFTNHIIRLFRDSEYRIHISNQAYGKLCTEFTFQHLSEKIKQLLAA